MVTVLRPLSTSESFDSQPMMSTLEGEARTVNAALAS